ncbi:cytochrome P450 [Xylaria palmicola]|nr:cytochrome P450 [Xylaria palmicola]
MGSISALQVFVAFVALTMITCCFEWIFRQQEYYRPVEVRAKEHRAIADFSFLNAQTLDERLILRSKPNARLVMAFDIENSFTTSDKHVHQAFLKKAQDAVRLVRTEDWVKLGGVTRAILNFCLGYFKDELPYTPLASVVRLVSFSLILHVLFGIEPSRVDVDEARKATEAINRLWIQSKNHHSVPSVYDKILLHNALNKLLPHESFSTDRPHPLDLIMPAYETLWRVVLLTFVSIASQNRDPDTAEELREAIANVPQCFCRDNDAEMRALAIAKEGLRLYPPTKRIYRATSTVEGESSVVAADVESCHRDRRVWGPDALQFRPSRFHAWSCVDPAYVARPLAPSKRLPVSDVQRLSYFPFGVGKNRCPAEAGFGDRIIALLVVELTRRFGTRQTGLKIHFGQVEDQQWFSTTLPSGRSDMEGWILEVTGHN